MVPCSRAHPAPGELPEAIDVWSVGCIYAELIGMLDGTKTEDRGPLFPGSSCFPLSPDHKHKTDYKYHTRGKHDQLNMIFNLLGTPSEAAIDLLEREDAKRYMKCFAPRDGDGLAARFPTAEKNGTDLLEQLLRFQGSDRIQVALALEHPLFDGLRDPAIEHTWTKPTMLTLDFEKEPDLDERLLRVQFCKEIQKYHPEVTHPK